MSESLAQPGASPIEQAAAEAAAAQMAAQEVAMTPDASESTQSTGEATSDQAPADARVEQIINGKVGDLGTRTVERGGLGDILRQGAIRQAKAEGHDVSHLEYAGRHDDPDESEAKVGKRRAPEVVESKHRLADIDSKRPATFPEEGWNALTREGKERLINFDAQLQHELSNAKTPEEMLGLKSATVASVEAKGQTLNLHQIQELADAAGKQSWMDTRAEAKANQDPKTSLRKRIASGISRLFKRNGVIEVAATEQVEPIVSTEATDAEPVDTPFEDLLGPRHEATEVVPGAFDENADDVVISKEENDRYDEEDRSRHLASVPAPAELTAEQVAQQADEHKLAA